MATQYKIGKAILSNKKYAVFAYSPQDKTWHTQKTFDSKKQANKFIKSRLKDEG